MAYQKQDKSWTERTGYGAQDAAPTDDIDRVLKKQGFQHTHTSIGGTGVLNVLGHYVALAGTLAPIAYGEFISDHATRWKATRITAMGTAVAYELIHTAHQLQREKAQNAKLADCKGRS